jgi:hypothetical protein
LRKIKSIVQPAINQIILYKGGIGKMRKMTLLLLLLMLTSEAGAQQIQNKYGAGLRLTLP